MRKQGTFGSGAVMVMTSVTRAGNFQHFKVKVRYACRSYEWIIREVDATVAWKRALDMWIRRGDPGQNDLTRYIIGGR